MLCHYLDALIIGHQLCNLKCTLNETLYDKLLFSIKKVNKIPRKKQALKSISDLEIEPETSGTLVGYMNFSVTEPTDCKDPSYRI